MGDRLKAVPGYSRYAVSDTGDVWSSGFLTRPHSGRRQRAVAAKRLRPTDWGPYGKKSVGIELVGDDGKRKLRSVANWMLRTFVGPPPAGCGTRHLNGDYRDNRIENLAWGTHSENMLDSVKHGTHAGARNGRAAALRKKIRDGKE